MSVSCISIKTSSALGPLGRNSQVTAPLFQLIREYFLENREAVCEFARMHVVYTIRKAVN